MDASIYSEAKKVFAVLNSSVQTEAEIKFALAFLEEADFFEQIADPAYRDECFMMHIVGEYATLLPDVSVVRAALETLMVDPYDWGDDPSVKAKVRSLASAEYNAGGSDDAKSVIDAMEDIEELKGWLKKLVAGDMDLGIKIIGNAGR